MPEQEIIEILDNLSIEIVVPSRSSSYTCCVFIETTPSGGVPPPYKHLKEEEIFTVLEGQYEFFKEGSRIPMSVGRSVLSLRNTYHAFRNAGETLGRMMLTTNGGGIDDYFRAISNLKMPEDVDRWNEISNHYGYIYLLPSES